MERFLLKIPYEFLFNCIKENLTDSEKTLIPTFLMKIVDVLPDGSCQFRSLANNVNTLKNERDDLMSMAKNMYAKVKDIVINVLPALTNDQLAVDYGFDEIDFTVDVIQNINNLISLHHGPEINNLVEYFKKFRYGTYTTNFELRILLSKPLAQYWLDTFDIPTPCVTVYIKERGYFIELTCLNKESFIDFRILYINDNHYQCMYMKEEYNNYFYQFIKDNSCKI